jgi:MscS family membrane protein
MSFIRLLDEQYLGNPISSYLLFLGILLFGFVFNGLLTRISSRFSFRLFKKFSKNQFSHEFLELQKKPFNLFFALIIIYVAFSQLDFPEGLKFKHFSPAKWRFYIIKGYEIVFIYSVAWILIRVVDFGNLVLKEKATVAAAASQSGADIQLIGFMRELVKIVVVIVAIFVVLGVVFRINVGGVVTGLGLGGLAIALAAQETISNLLGSFIIFMDKPFKTGDLISVDNITGTVENVGFRSTRIRTTDKSLLTVPNKKLVDNPLNNITLSSYRRVRFNINLSYDTKAEQLKNISAAVKEYLASHKQVTGDITVLFTDFSANSLDLLVVFFVETNSWDLMMEVKQEVNFRIMEIVETHGAEFAKPTPPVAIDKNPRKT